MRIYVAGAAGMLGEAIQRVLGKQCQLYCSDIAPNADWIECCDMRERDKYFMSVKRFRPHVLLHCGAHTDLEYCERNSIDAYETNALSVVNAVQIATRLDLKLVYISTAGVFSGKQDTYADWDAPSPINVYGHSKYMGEVIVQRMSSRYFICRAGWMMGGGPALDKKFVNKIIRQLQSGSKNLHAVVDKFGAPTYSVDFARNLGKLIETDQFGLYNMAGMGTATRFEVASELLSILGVNDQVRLTPVLSTHFSDDYFVSRPTSERLLNCRLEELKLNLMRDWRTSLREYISDYFAGEARLLKARQPSLIAKAI